MLDLPRRFGWSPRNSLWTYILQRVHLREYSHVNYFINSITTWFLFSKTTKKERPTETILFLYLSNRSKLCPLDRKPLAEKDLKEPGLSFRNLLAKVIALCDNSPYCLWMSQWGMLKDHLAKECTFAKVINPVWILLEFNMNQSIPLIADLLNIYTIVFLS